MSFNANLLLADRLSQIYIKNVVNTYDKTMYAEF